MKRLILALAFLPLASAADAEQPCGSRDAILKTAHDNYGEIPTAGGANRDGSRFTELLLAPDGSWTVIMSRPDGYTCVVSSGIGWDKLGGIPGEDG